MHVRMQIGRSEHVCGAYVAFAVLPTSHPASHYMPEACLTATQRWENAKS